MRRLSFTAVALVLPVAPLAAQLPTEMVRRIDSVFVGIDRTGSPGCALGVYRDTGIVYARGYGMANLEHGIAITPRSIFDIGSTSKQFAAAAIALLAQDGKLSLDDDVRRHVPELPAYEQPITIRHLLNHTSGLRDYLTLMSLRGTNFDGVTTDREALELIVRQKATNFPPGSEFLYSNSGFFLLSTIVQRASGLTLARFAAERIFTPLGMTQTHFHDDHTLVTPLRATGYAPRAGGGWRIDMSGFEQTGDGAVYTSVEELVRWDANFYQPTVGGQRLLDDLHTQGRLTTGRTLNYALGLFVDEYRGNRRVRHGGAWAGYRADLVRFPEHRTSVAALCNFASANPSAYADRVADIVLGASFRETATSPPTSAAARSVNTPSVTLSATHLARLAGRYRDPATGIVRDFTTANGALVDARLPRSPLVARDSLHFTSPAAPLSISFELSPSGAVARVIEEIQGASRTVFSPFTPFAPTTAQLKEYEGSYYVPEIDAAIAVAAEPTRPSVRFGAADPRPLSPTVRDIFSAGGQTVLSFVRDGRGRITGVSINAGRVRDIRGERTRN